MRSYKTAIFLLVLLILTIVPESIGNLENLNELLLESAQLTTLPASVGKLTKLRGIQCDDNRLQSLPKSMSNLSNLRFLWILRDKFYDPLPEEDLLYASHLFFISSIIAG